MNFKTSNTNFKLRFASEKDIPTILYFIKELATYEKLEHEVVATSEVLKESLFGKHKNAEVIIGAYKSKPVAFALFFHNFSTFLGKNGIYIEDIYVKPEYRGKGFGKSIFSFLAKLAKDRNCGRLEWWCLDWNKSALKFYKSLGAKPMDEWTVQRISGKDLDQLAGEKAE